MTSQHKLIAATAAIAVLAGGGAALAAIELTSSSPDATSTATAPVPGHGYGLGAGMLGGRGLSGGVGPGSPPGDSGRPFGGRRFLAPSLTAAAGYLGVSTSTLRLDLAAGMTLAQVASSQGTSVDGLVGTMVAAQKRELARAVAAGLLTQAQADSSETGLQAQTAAFVNGVRAGRSIGPPGPTTT